MSGQTRNRGRAAQHRDRVMAAIAARQHDVVSHAQLLAAGISDDHIEARVKRGTLHGLFRGVYAVGSGRPTARGWWMAGVLACGPGAMLCRDSAASLFDVLASVLVLPVHVLAPTQRRKQAGLVPHRTRHWPEAVVVDGIPVTPIERTLADLPAHMRDDAATRARIKRLTTDGPAYRSFAERDVHRMLADLGIGAEVNRTVAGDERDLVIVEVDGPHHELAHVRAEDARRDARARAAGARVVRLSPSR